jgi:uncharacterized protein
MLALRLVIDTNVLVSAALKPDSLQRTTFLLAITKPARLYVSTPILEEYADVLSRSELLQLIKNKSRLVAPSRRIEVTSDPDDNIFVECADAARPDFLVTGNRKHLPPFWKSTKIITPREFISLVAPHLIR